MITIKGDRATIRTETFSCDIHLQPSGACLVEGRFWDIFMSKYERDVLRDKTMDGFMYGNSTSVLLDEAALDLIFHTCAALRKGGNWDSKYAPDASFRGNNMYPIDDSGLRSHPQMQGYKEHRYDT